MEMRNLKTLCWSPLKGLFAFALSAVFMAAGAFAAREATTHLPAGPAGRGVTRQGAEVQRRRAAIVNGATLACGTENWKWWDA